RRRLWLCRGCRRRRRATIELGQHIALGQSPILAAGGDGARLELVLLDQATNRRTRAFEQRIRRRALGICRRGLSGRGLNGSGLGRRGFRRRRRRFAPRIADDTEKPANADIGPFRNGHRSERAGGGRIDLERHLVGFELDEGVVDRDAVADLLEPLGNRSLGDRFAQSRYLYFGRHSYLACSQIFRASLFHGQRVVDQLGLLLDVALGQPGGRRGGLGSTGIGRALRRDVEPGQNLLDASVD